MKHSMNQTSTQQSRNTPSAVISKKPPLWDGPGYDAPSEVLPGGPIWIDASLSWLGPPPGGGSRLARRGAFLSRFPQISGSTYQHNNKPTKIQQLYTQ